MVLHMNNSASWNLLYQKYIMSPISGGILLVYRVWAVSLFCSFKLMALLNKFIFTLVLTLYLDEYVSCDI